MKERPILFSGAMVRAILAGRKTQTRRPIMHFDGSTHAKDPARVGEWKYIQKMWCAFPANQGGSALAIYVMTDRYGQPGDRLFVRETGWQRPERTMKMMREGADTWEPYYFDADGISEQDAADFKKWGFKRRPSIHMPRKASRINLDVSRSWIERLHDISEADAIAEGVPPELVPPDGGSAPHVEGFRTLWDSINVHRMPWRMNPWVQVTEFARA